MMQLNKRWKTATNRLSVRSCIPLIVRAALLWLHDAIEASRNRRRRVWRLISPLGKPPIIIGQFCLLIVLVAARPELLGVTATSFAAGIAVTTAVLFS